MEIFGDVLLRDENNVPFETLKKILELPVVKPRFRLSALTPDEQIDFVIPEKDIILSSLNYTENYQNGQRRSLSVTLANEYGQYTPNINKIWINTKFRYEVGIQYGSDIVWFPKRIYILSEVSLTRNNSDKQISLSLSDKYALFESKASTLETAYEVELGSDIIDAVKGVLNFAQGNGYILDYKEPIFDPSFVGMKTQQTIRAEQGENLSSIIDALATQLSAEYYYNTVGNLCFYQLNETIDDSAKPVIWTYQKIGKDLHNMNLSYQNENVINCVKVVGDNVDSDVYTAVVENNNPASPICVERIGRRMDSPYTSSQVWSEDLARDLANYYLRQSSFIGVSFSMYVSFNPILTVNNLCEVEDSFLELDREKLLITSISYSAESGQIQLSCCNTADLPTNISQKVSQGEKLKNG